MAEPEQTTGAIFTQSGAPVRGSADYQRVYDSRWRFMEVEIERDFKMTFPARDIVDFSGAYYDKFLVIKHGLGFVPFFETDFPDQDFTIVGPLSIWADKDKIFVQRFVSSQGAEAQEIEFNVRVYNLPVLHDYEAPKEPPQGLSSPRSDIGIRFIDDNARSVNLAGRSPVGFSVDTKKKILSIHKHGLARLNDWTQKYASVTAINTTTNALSVTENQQSNLTQAAGWTQQVGTRVRYNPDDFVTYPGGMSDQHYFIIPNGVGSVKLATTIENAKAGIAVDITSTPTGSVPGSLQGMPTDGSYEDSILHDVGYPPTILMAEVNYNQGVSGMAGIITNPKPDVDSLVLGPMLNIILARTSADDKYMTFRGVQAVFGGWYGYVVLKDPAEIAR